MGQTGKKTPRAPANSSVVITTLVVIAAVGLGGGRHGSHLAHAYSEGAPDNACSTMRPLHGASKQAVPSPYSILLSSQEVLPSQILTVTLNGSEFKGFMVTAFASDFRLGTMIAKNDTAKTICDNLSITHTSRVQKTEVTFDWMAPDDLLEGTLINFVATMVKERLVYWMDVVQLNPLVGVETPPDLPIEGGGTTDGTAGDATITESVPTGVLPTPGTAAPATTPTFVAGGNSNAADANAAHSNQVIEWIATTLAGFLVALLELLY